MATPSKAPVVPFVRVLVILSSVSIFASTISPTFRGTFLFHGIPKKGIFSTVLTESSGLDRKKSISQLDLGTCDQQSEVPCIESGTCESVPLLEPARCRRRYCPTTKVYCLDFNGCMMYDPIFVFANTIKEKKCPIPLSLCANKDTCQFVLRKNYDDLREPSVDRLNCSIMTNRIVFTNSSCKVHGDCHWTAKCCPDGGLNRQCVSYDGRILPARISKELDDNSTTPMEFTSVPFNYGPSWTAEPGPTSLLNLTKSAIIRITNSFDISVEGRLSKFEMSMSNQLAKLLCISESVFTKMIEQNGSIFLEVNMTPSLTDELDEVNQAFLKLTSMLINGTLVLTDLNGTKLDIPPQENGTLLITETTSNSNILVGVTAASLAFTFLLVFWVVCNLKKSKTINPIDRTHPHRLNSHMIFVSKQSIENHVPDNLELRQNSRSKLSPFAESQVQWHLFQQHFPAKPDHVWKSQDEVVWAGSEHQLPWPELTDAPDEQSVAIVKKN